MPPGVQRVAMLHRSFKPEKCKTSLKLATARIKLLRNKKDAQIRQLKREVSQLLETGQDQTARIRVEHVIQEQKTVSVYELTELYCELIVARLVIVESQKDCPKDLKEAVAGVMFASQRCADITELVDVRKHFTEKYGKEFVKASLEARNESGVNPMLIGKLAATAPDIETKVKVLTAIAEEYDIKWEPKSFEEQLQKPHENTMRTAKHELTKNLSKNKEKRSVANSNSLSTSTSIPTISQPEPRTPVRSLEDQRFKCSYSGDEKTASDQQNWNMGFRDATSAAEAAAESAEWASMAAKAAAKLASRTNDPSPYPTKSFPPSVNKYITGRPPLMSSKSMSEQVVQDPMEIDGDRVKKVNAWFQGNDTAERKSFSGKSEGIVEDCGSVRSMSRKPTLHPSSHSSGDDMSVIGREENYTLSQSASERYTVKHNFQREKIVKENFVAESSVFSMDGPAKSKCSKLSGEIVQDQIEIESNEINNTNKTSLGIKKQQRNASRKDRLSGESERTFNDHGSVTSRSHMSISYLYSQTSDDEISNTTRQEKNVFSQISSDQHTLNPREKISKADSVSESSVKNISKERTVKLKCSNLGEQIVQSGRSVSSQSGRTFEDDTLSKQYKVKQDFQRGEISADKFFAESYIYNIIEESPGKSVSLKLRAETVAQGPSKMNCDGKKSNYRSDSAIQSQGRDTVLQNSLNGRPERTYDDHESIKSRSGRSISSISSQALDDGNSDVTQREMNAESQRSSSEQYNAKQRETGKDISFTVETAEDTFDGNISMLDHQNSYNYAKFFFSEEKITNKNNKGPESADVWSANIKEKSGKFSSISTMSSFEDDTLNLHKQTDEMDLNKNSEVDGGLEITEYSYLQQSFDNDAVYDDDDDDCLDDDHVGINVFANDLSTYPNSPVQGTESSNLSLDIDPWNPNSQYRREILVEDSSSLLNLMKDPYTAALAEKNEKEALPSKSDTLPPNYDDSDGLTSEDEEKKIDAFLQRGICHASLLHVETTSIESSSVKNGEEAPKYSLQAKKEFKVSNGDSQLHISDGYEKSQETTPEPDDDALHIVEKTAKEELQDHHAPGRRGQNAAALFSPEQSTSDTSTVRVKKLAISGMNKISECYELSEKELLSNKTSSDASKEPYRTINPSTRSRRSRRSGVSLLSKERSDDGTSIIAKPYIFQQHQSSSTSEFSPHEASNQKSLGKPYETCLRRPISYLDSINEKDNDSKQCHPTLNEESRGSNLSLKTRVVSLYSKVNPIQEAPEEISLRSSITPADLDGDKGEDAQPCSPIVGRGRKLSYRTKDVSLGSKVSPPLKTDDYSNTMCTSDMQSKPSQLTPSMPEHNKISVTLTDSSGLKWKWKSISSKKSSMENTPMPLPLLQTEEFKSEETLNLSSSPPRNVSSESKETPKPPGSSYERLDNKQDPQFLPQKSVDERPSRQIPETADLDGNETLTSFLHVSLSTETSESKGSPKSPGLSSHEITDMMRDMEFLPPKSFIEQFSGQNPQTEDLTDPETLKPSMHVAPPKLSLSSRGSPRSSSVTSHDSMDKNQDSKSLSLKPSVERPSLQIPPTEDFPHKEDLNSPLRDLTQPASIDSKESTESPTSVANAGTKLPSHVVRKPPVHNNRLTEMFQSLRPNRRLW